MVEIEQSAKLVVYPNSVQPELVKRETIKFVPTSSCPAKEVDGGREEQFWGRGEGGLDGQGGGAEADNAATLLPHPAIMR